MDKTISQIFGTLFYRVEGAGIPVMLIHGFAEDGGIWKSQVDHLKKDFLLIIPDLAGSGHSAVQDPRQLPATIDDHAGLLKAILQTEGITRCVVIGHSMGGYVALALAEKYPDFVAAIGLFHSTAYADSEDKKAARAKGISFIRKHGAPVFIRQTAPDLFSETTQNQKPEIISGLIDKYDNFNANSLVSYYEAMIGRPDRTAVLRHFPGPVLFICGENDRAVPLEHSLQQSYIPDLSYIHILDQVGHMGMLEAPFQVNDLLSAFIKNVRV